MQSDVRKDYAQLYCLLHVHCGGRVNASCEFLPSETLKHTTELHQCAMHSAAMISY